MKLLKNKRSGFILLESLVSLAISLLIIFTLTICVSEQFKLLNQWEHRVTAHKIIWLHLKSPAVRDPVIVKNEKYYFQQKGDLYQVIVGHEIYQIKPKET